ncbi:MAG: 2-oxo acid dehydrogenase subunit E2, partial [Gammaproteobacteria bacterium]|nr:2-oxo acid dehydrogenase subunit E2 [Gammaproteobacteria bacterium]
MKVDITVPELAESITEAVIGEWLKKPGEWIEDGEQLVDIETDKVILEVTAPQRGELASISKQTGEQVQSNEVIAVIDTSKKGRKTAAPGKEQKEKPATQKNSEPELADAASKAAPDSTAPAEEPVPSKTSPAVRKLAEDHGVDVRSIKGTGKGGRITKQDVQARIEDDRDETAPAADMRVSLQEETEVTETRKDRRVPMTNLRKTIARRLAQAQQQSAMLTTFNEVNMNNIKCLRNKYKEEFEKKHGVKLGFMSFFIKASIEALKEFSIINASIEDEDIV